MAIWMTKKRWADREDEEMDGTRETRQERDGERELKAKPPAAEMGGGGGGGGN
jgi:hypothetical protein